LRLLQEAQRQKNVQVVRDWYASYVNTNIFKGAAEILKDDNKVLDDLYDSFEPPINKKINFNML